MLPALLVLAIAGLALPDEIVKRVGQVTIGVDTTHAYQGGVFVVRLRSRRSLGTVFALLEGRRAPFFPAPPGPRALVPIPVTSSPGSTLLGIEIMARTGRQRVAVDVSIAPRSYPPRTTVLPAPKEALLKQPASGHDGRKLLLWLRTITPQALWTGLFRAPVPFPGAGFGGEQTYVGNGPVEERLDAVYGEYHRGQDYDVPPGTIVQAPAAGKVLFAGPLELSGLTLVLDHGQGVVSVFFHLSRTSVRAGEDVSAGATLGLSGSTGLAASPHLHWGVYVNGVAVSPAVFERFQE